MMKLNVGAGSTRLDGYQSVDIRALGRDSRRGHAADLSFAADHTVDVVFSNAVFEHVYPAHRLAVLREWKRVLAPTGAIICMGLPDLEAIAAAYLAGGQGATGERFDLFEVYRYTHGHPEQTAAPIWSRWSPSRHADSAPAGYLPQLHKGLFDGQHLSDLLNAVGLPASLFRYAYPGEKPVISIGFVAGRGCDDAAVATAHLDAVPDGERFYQPLTVAWSQLAPLTTDRMLGEVERLDTLRAPSRRRVAARRVKQLVRKPL